MRVYSCPAELPAPVPDYATQTIDTVLAAELAHQAQLQDWLVAHGYNGSHTGGIASFAVGDGAASYMLGDKGAQSILLHLPYGDGCGLPHIERLSTQQILENIEGHRQMIALFGSQNTEEVPAFGR